MVVDQKLIQEVWNKGIVDERYPSDLVRKDACGAYIKFDKFGDRGSLFGWEIDHIYPASMLQEKGISQPLIDNILNLRPLNWKNNLSKGGNYPFYTAVIVADDEAATNKEEEVGKVVNETIQSALNKLFNLQD